MKAIVFSTNLFADIDKVKQRTQTTKQPQKIHTKTTNMYTN